MPPSAAPIWAHLNAEERESQYNPRVAVPDFARHEAEFTADNAAAREWPSAVFDVPYGSHPLRRLDIFPAQGAPGVLAPVHVFFHGGFWRALDKAAFSYVAGALAPLGFTTVVANYELCPASTLDGVVDSALAAFEWVQRHIARYGGDPAHISISGASAGAHLCGEILSADWAARGFPEAHVDGAALISGIFDPEPARLTSLNREICLDAGLVARHNLELRPPTLLCPLTLAVGGAEPWQWIDQSFRYSHHLRRHEIAHTLHVLPGRNHFSIMRDYLAEDSLVRRAIAAMKKPAG